MVAQKRRPGDLHKEMPGQRGEKGASEPGRGARSTLCRTTKRLIKRHSRRRALNGRPYGEHTACLRHAAGPHDALSPPDSRDRQERHRSLARAVRDHADPEHTHNACASCVRLSHFQSKDSKRKPSPSQTSHPISVSRATVLEQVPPFLSSPGTQQMCPSNPAEQRTNTAQETLNSVAGGPTHPMSVCFATQPGRFHLMDRESRIVSSKVEQPVIRLSNIRYAGQQTPVASTPRLPDFVVFSAIHGLYPGYRPSASAHTNRARIGR